MFDLLVDLGADMNIKNRRDLTPLTLAAKLARKEASRLMIGRLHYSDVMMSAMVSHITSLTIVYSTVYSGADQRKHQSSASLAFVRGIHR